MVKTELVKMLIECHHSESASKIEMIRGLGI
jgi:hypothetical protein